MTPRALIDQVTARLTAAADQRAAAVHAAHGRARWAWLTDGQYQKGDGLVQLVQVGRAALATAALRLTDRVSAR